MSFLKNSILLLCTALIFNACDSKSEIDESLIADVSKNKPVAKEYKEYKFTLTTTDGKTLKLTTLKDKGMKIEGLTGEKAVLIDVFATWCPPCIKSVPDLNALRDKYKNDFEIISVLFEKPEDKPKEEVLAFIKEHGVTYPVTIGEANFELSKKALGNVQKIPEYFLYAKDGTFVKKFVGESDKKSFEEAIKEAIK